MPGIRSQKHSVLRDFRDVRALGTRDAFSLGIILTLADKEVRPMVKSTLKAAMFLSVAITSWSSYRALATPRAETARTAAVEPLSSEAAYRHRNALPTHWRGYVLQQRRY